jgi:hypothetical protein
MCSTCYVYVLRTAENVFSCRCVCVTVTYSPYGATSPSSPRQVSVTRCFILPEVNSRGSLKESYLFLRRQLMRRGFSIFQVEVWYN